MDRPFLVGKKVYFRPLEVEDINSRYLQWVNDGSVILGRVEVYLPVTKEAQETYVRSQLNRHDVAFFAIMERPTNKFIGTAKMGPINWVHRFTEHALMIGDKTCWNKGYGGEVIHLLLEYGFRWLNMHKIYASINVSNIASIRTHERIGYKTEAVLKERRFIDGRYQDEMIMSMSQGEFQKLHPESIIQKDYNLQSKSNDEATAA